MIDERAIFEWLRPQLKSSVWRTWVKAIDCAILLKDGEVQGEWVTLEPDGIIELPPLDSNTWDTECVPKLVAKGMTVNFAATKYVPGMWRIVDDNLDSETAYCSWCSIDRYEALTQYLQVREG